MDRRIAGPAALAVVLLAISLTACRQAPAPTSTPPTQPDTGSDQPNHFQRLLATIPDDPDLRAGGVRFSDHRRQKQNSGYEHIRTAQDFSQLTEDEKRAYISAVLWMPEAVVSGARMLLKAEWPQALGYDFWQVDRQVFAGERPGQWARLEGAFDEAAIAAALATQGYERSSAAGKTLLSLVGTDGAALAGDTFVGHLISGNLEHVILDQDSLTAAPTAGLAQASLAAQTGSARSLAADPDYSALGQGFGPVVAATVLPGERFYVPSTLTYSTTSTATWSIDQILGSYRLDDPDHPRLHAYNLAGWGIQADGANRTMLIGLTYTHADEAQADAPILRQRLLDYRLFEGVGVPVKDVATVGEPQLLTVGERTVLLQPLILDDRLDWFSWSRMLEGSDALYLTTR